MLLLYYYSDDFITAINIQSVSVQFWRIPILNIQT